MRKLGRAEQTTGSSKSTRRRKANQTSRTGNSRLTNWLAAQSRAARHRLSYVFKLAGVTMAGMAALVVAGLAAFGQLDDAGDVLVDSAQARLANSGYTVRWLDVTGSTHLSVEEIAALIEVEPGLGLADLDLQAAKSRLEAQSWIDSAELFRLWPDRIGVIIRERSAFALWQINEVHHVIDDRGAIIEDAVPANYADLPRLVGAGANTAGPEFLPLLAMHSQLIARTTHVLRIGERRWSLRLNTGTEILLPQNDVASALATLTALHEERGLFDYDAQIIDLRNSGELVMRPWPNRATEQAGRGA